MVFQDPSATLNPVLTIETQMRLTLEAHERVGATAARDRSADLLARVGIPDARRRLETYPHQLSGGMRQRVAIAIALLNRPSLIVCDEPTTALDVSIQAQILAQMKALAADFGTALIWISHDLATVSALASRILVMYAGRIVEEGPTGEVLRKPAHPYTQGLLDSLPSTAAPGEDLRQIPGSTPSLADLPQGCAFAPRCAFADVACGRAPTTRRAGARAAHHGYAVEQSTARARRLDARDHATERGFAAPRFADKPQNFALGDLERHVVDCVNGTRARRAPQQARDTVGELRRACKALDEISAGDQSGHATSPSG
jgi:peptide/nickel transport system ATP-binding protein